MESGKHLWGLSEQSIYLPIFLLICPLGIRGTICTSAFCLFFFLLFSFLFFCLWADDLNDHHLRQRAASHLRYPRLISASYLHPPNQRACLKSPLSLLRPHTPFYRARIAEHCGFNHTAMEIISISIPTCRSFPFLGLIRVHARRQIQLTLCPLTVTSK